MSSDKIFNINTDVNEVFEHFSRMLNAMKELELSCPEEYRRGFRDGVRALQMRYLRRTEKDKAASGEEDV